MKGVYSANCCSGGWLLQVVWRLRSSAATTMTLTMATPTHARILFHLEPAGGAASIGRGIMVGICAIMGAGGAVDCSSDGAYPATEGANDVLGGITGGMHCRNAVLNSSMMEPTTAMNERGGMPLFLVVLFSWWN